MPSTTWGNTLDQVSATTQFLRKVRVTWLICCGVFTVLFIFPFCTSEGKLRHKKRWSASLLFAMGIEVQGDLTSIAPRAMLVANHISWVDIFVINALLPSAFVAKEEVRDWPIFGWLAAKNDTLFMQRESRAQARKTNEEIAQVLNQGKYVVVFPEGTTSDGCRLLPFHGALLQPALSAACPVVPIAIRYHHENGEVSLAPRYDGDISFGECLNAIVSQKRTIATLSTTPALGMKGESRRQVAQQARHAIAVASGIHLEEAHASIEAGKHSDDAFKAV